MTARVHNLRSPKCVPLNMIVTVSQMASHWATAKEWSSLPSQSPQHNHHSSGSDQQTANDGWRGELLAKQQPGEDNYQRHAKLVQRSHARSRAQLQSAKITNPGQAGGEAR